MHIPVWPPVTQQGAFIFVEIWKKVITLLLYKMYLTGV